MGEQFFVNLPKQLNPKVFQNLTLLGRVPVLYSRMKCDMNRCVWSHLSVFFVVISTGLVGCHWLSGSITSITHNSSSSALTPSSLTLQSPGYDFDNSAEIQILVSETRSGDRVALYSDSSCTTKVSEQTSSGSSVVFTVNLTSYGSYSYWAKSIQSSGATSSCSSVSVTYTYAKKYTLDPTETQTLADQTLDGVCATVNSKCSFQAAVTEMNSETNTPILLSAPAGTYTVSSSIPSLVHPNFVFRGASASTTIIDGGGSSPIISTLTGTTRAEFSHFTLQNTSGGIGVNSLVTLANILKISNCTIANNTNTSSGSVIRATTSLTVDTCTLHTNSLNTGYLVHSLVSLMVRNSTFYSNSGISEIRCSGECNVISSLFRPTSVTFNLDIRNTTGTSTIENTTFSQTGAANFIRIQNSSGGGSTIRISHVTAYTTVGLVMLFTTGTVATTLNLYNSILTTEGAGTSCTLGGTFTFDVKGSASDHSSCQTTGATNQIVSAGTLQALASNGGDTQTHLPANGSPLIDAGESAYCNSTDQRGYARPVKKTASTAKCDIGAVEVQ